MPCLYQNILSESQNRAATPLDENVVRLRIAECFPCHLTFKDAPSFLEQVISAACCIENKMNVPKQT